MTDLPTTRLREIVASLQASNAVYDSDAAEVTSWALHDELVRRFQLITYELAAELLKDDIDPDVDTSERSIDAVSDAIEDLREWWQERVGEIED